MDMPVRIAPNFRMLGIVSPGEKLASLGGLCVDTSFISPEWQRSVTQDTER